MTTLQTLISSLTDLSNPQAIYSDITTKNVEKVVGNKDTDIRGIEFVYGREFTIELLAGMENIVAAVTASGDLSSAKYLQIQFDRLITGTGQNFSDRFVRKQLDDLVLAGLLPALAAEKLKNLGIVMESKWSQITTEPEPTLEEVDAAVAFEVSNRNILSWVNYVKNGILSNNGNGKSIAELKALIQEYN